MRLTRRSVLAGSLLASTASFRGLRAQSAGPIRVGLVAPFSGYGADLANSLQYGAKIAAAQWNRDGGLLGRQIELEIRDDKFTGDGAVGGLRELAGKGVNLMIGGGQTVMALAIAPLLTDLKVMNVMPSPGGMALTHELFTRNMFRTVANVWTNFAAEARAMSERFPAVAKWAIIAPAGAFGEDVSKIFTHAIANGRKTPDGKAVEVMPPFLVAPSGTDYKNQITAMMSGGAEGVFVGVVYGSAITFYQQAHQAGLDKLVKVLADAGTEVLIGKAMERNTPPSLWSASFWVPDAEPFKSNPISNALYKDYVAMANDTHPNGIVQLGHRAMLTILHAVKRAGSTDTDAVIAAAEGMEFETAVGHYRIRKEDHQGLGKSIYVKISPSEQAPYYGITDVIQIDDEQAAEPPSPGKKFDIPA